MRSITLVTLAGVIGGIASQFLPPTPGITNAVTFIGAVAAMAGGAMGMCFNKLPLSGSVGVIIVALVVFIVGIIQFRQTSNLEPSQNVALFLYIWSAVIFMPVGIIVEMSGSKL